MVDMYLTSHVLARRTCASNQFACSDELFCVPGGWLCDGEEDCVDGSDELNCKLISVLDCAQL